MSNPSSLLFYVVLSYGKKPDTRKILDHPAAAGQIANLRLSFPSDEDRQDRFVWDYARKITKLGDLPRLNNFLQKATKLKSGALMVIPPFLTGWIRRTYAAIFSFCAGVMPPMPIFGRSLL